MREELKIHRDFEKEKALRAVLEEIEEMLERPDIVDETVMEQKILEAKQLMPVSNRSTDLLYSVSYYDGWTSMDGLVGELTLEVPKVEDITEQNFKELILWMRKIIHGEEQLDEDEYDYEYFDNYYHEFFDVNFADGKKLYAGIFEDNSVEELIGMAFHDGSLKKNDNVIYL